MLLAQVISIFCVIRVLQTLKEINVPLEMIRPYDDDLDDLKAKMMLIKKLLLLHSLLLYLNQLMTKILNTLV